MQDWYKPSGSLHWPFETTAAMWFAVDPTGDRYLVSSAATGKTLAHLDCDGLLCILPGYQFDGATCAPDFERIMPAVLLHDLLCQCAGHQDWPIDRREADRWFLRTAQSHDARLAWIYYTGIRIFGGIHRLLARPKPDAAVTVTVLDDDEEEFFAP